MNKTPHVESSMKQQAESSVSKTEHDESPQSALC